MYDGFGQNFSTFTWNDADVDAWEMRWPAQQAAVHGTKADEPHQPDVMRGPRFTSTGPLAGSSHPLPHRISDVGRPHSVGASAEPTCDGFGRHFEFNEKEFRKGRRKAFEACLDYYEKGGL